jgi:hypothetical protein
LYLLFFLWLFAFSGLLLNHSWKFAEFWDSRHQSTNQVAISLPPPGGDLAQARDLMRQLGVAGEIEWTRSRDKPERLDFRVSRPGHIVEVRADFANQRATLNRIDLNYWGITRILHTFTGVRLEDRRNERDWWLTTIWALAMDAVALGLVFLVASSLWMWFELRQKRRWGLVALSAGAVVCGLFCFGLRWLY